MEKSIHMDTDIPSEDHPNQPIEIKGEQEATQEASQNKSKGKQVANK